MAHLAWPRNVDINLPDPVCTLCGNAAYDIKTLTQILFKGCGTKAKLRLPGTRNYCLLICASNATCAFARLSEDIRRAIAFAFKNWSLDLDQLSWEQICIVIKATQRTLMPADGGKSRIIDPKQISCFICRWKMKSPGSLRADGDRL